MSFMPYSSSFYFVRDPSGLRAGEKRMSCWFVALAIPFFCHAASFGGYAPESSE